MSDETLIRQLNVDGSESLVRPDGTEVRRVTPWSLGSWWPLALRSTVEQQEADKRSLAWELERAEEREQQLVDDLEMIADERRRLEVEVAGLKRQLLRAEAPSPLVAELARARREASQHRRNAAALDDRLAAAERRPVHGVSQ